MARAIAVIAVIGAGLVGSAQAAQQPMTGVSVKSWRLTLQTGRKSKKEKASPGSTVSRCASARLTHLDINAFVTNARKGQHFSQLWFHDGHLRDRYHLHFGNTSTGPTGYIGIYNKGGLPAGRWTTRFVQSGKTIGSSSLTITVRHSC